MSRKRILIAAAGLLIVGGAVAAISAPGERWGRHGGHMMSGDEGHGHDMRGRFGRSLTKDEYDARARERFARIDKNSDGVLDMAEIEAALAAHGERHKRWAGRGEGRMGQNLIRQFDGNRDGKVTVEEARAEIERRFKEADLDSNGRIDDADLPPMMRGRNWIAEGGKGPMGRHGGGMGLHGALREADANKDGVVTREEAQALADRQHARFDLNKDGAVDQADADALRKEMQDYRAKRFVHTFGADKEGRVTREQFMAKAADRFARMDADNDGSISRSERGGHGWGRGGHRGSHHGGGQGMMEGGFGHGPGHGHGRGPGAPGADPATPGEPPARN